MNENTKNNCDKCVLKCIWNFIVNSVKVIFIIYFFILAINFANNDKTVQMLAFIASGFLFSFMFFASKLTQFFDSINIAGLGLKMKEARDIVQDLKLIIKNLALLTLDETQLKLCKGKPRINEIERNFEIIKEMLYKYNLPQQEIEILLEEHWHKWVYRNYTKLIINCVKNDTDFQNKFHNEWHKKNEPFESLENLKEFIGKYHIEDEDKFKQILDDYEYYFKNKSHKSIEAWEENLKSLPDNNYWANTPK